jgi:hypothetical protein
VSAGPKPRAIVFILGLLRILEIGQPPIFLCHPFQLAFGRFMRRKGCLSATDAFKRSEAVLFHPSEIDGRQLCSKTNNYLRRRQGPLGHRER